MISQLLVITIFLTIIFLHIAKKNFTAVSLYFIQSCAITILLLQSSLEVGSLLLMFVAMLTFAVKGISAPWFFVRLIKKHRLKFSASTYLSLPLALIIVAALTTLTHSPLFAPISSIAPDHKELLLLSLAAVLASFFLIINRKGAISQMIGILSMENSIVAFAIFSGLEQAPGLQIGVMFNIFIWIIIATVFASMIYKQFGSLDVSTMKQLKD